jgi:hypothetical protein
MSDKKQLLGLYAGVVEDNADPENVGRLRIRVPHIYGPTGETVAIATPDIPWAMPAGLPAGLTDASGGIAWLPENGDQVYVQFLDGEPEKPVWLWGNQTRLAARKTRLHQYDDKKHKPIRSALTRYGHTIEFNETSIIVTTKQGNAFMLDDSVDGGIIKLNEDFSIRAKDLSALLRRLDVKVSKTVRVDAGKSVVVKTKDMGVSVEEELIVHAGEKFTLLVPGEDGSSIIRVADGAVGITNSAGSSFMMDPDGNVALTTQDGTTLSMTKDGVQMSNASGSNIKIDSDKVTVSGQQIAINGGTIGLGEGASMAVVLAELLTLLFNTHTHSNGNNGSPTGPPIVPMMPNQISSTSTTAV